MARRTAIFVVRITPMTEPSAKAMTQAAQAVAIVHPKPVMIQPK